MVAYLSSFYGTEGIPDCEFCALRLCENPSGVMQVSRKGAKIPPLAG